MVVHLFLGIFISLFTLLGGEIFALPAQTIIGNNPAQPALSSMVPTGIDQNDDIVIEEEDFQFSQKNPHATPPASQPKQNGPHKDKSTSSNPNEEQPDIYLNFENSSLANVVNYMAELHNINLLPDKTLADIKVSLSIRQPLTKAEAWKRFLTVLEVAGFSIVEVDGLHKVMPKDKKLTEALPSYINVPYTTLPESDLTIRYVMFLQNLQVDAVKDLLDSLLSDKHTLFPYAQANCFIITDRCYNIKSAMKIIQELDSTGQAETVVVMRLKRTNATDVKGLLEGLMKKTESNPLARLFAKSTDTSTEYFPAGTKIVPEERTNSLILMGSPDPIKKIEKFITDYIDVELKAAESPLHIYELQYADATQIADILKEVTAPPDQGPGQQAAKYGAIRGGVKYFKSMKFLADKEANRLIISCTDKQDWQMVKGIIKDLDKPQPQVAMETLFVEITANDLDQMGGAIRNPKASTLGGSINFQSAPAGGTVSLSEPQDANKDPVTLLGDMFKQIISGQGASILTFGRKTNIWAIFETIRTRSNASILSQPFITIANKVTGKISVGEERNVLMEEGASGGGKGYGQVTADTSLEIEPQINLDGVIRLKINVNISEFTNASLGEKSNKQVSTNVTMADGQVLVLGGFVKTKVGESTSKTPLLSNIPILGWFFKNQSRTIDRRYIFIFMAPTIVKPRTAPGVELYTKMKLHAATNDIEDGIKTVKTNDPLFNWFFDPKKENYSHKVVDFANARYQPTSVDIKHDPYYRVDTGKEENKTSFPETVDRQAPTIFSTPPTSPTQTAVPAATTRPSLPVQPPAIITAPLIPAAPALITQGSISPQQAQPTALSASQSVMQRLAASPTQANTTPNAKKMIEERLGLTPSLQDRPQAPVLIQSPDALSRLASNSDEQPAEEIEESSGKKETISQEEAQPHEAQEEVLALLNNRLQQQRQISVDDTHLASQRKKLKSLITQTYDPKAQTEMKSNTSKQAALKSLLEVPSTQKTSPGELVVDPAKRNSLKDFLSHAEQPATSTRNSPT